MLQTQTIEPATLSLLKKLMQLPELLDFSLVGGTALSLYYGHRLSIDLDLFSTKDFSNDDLIPALENAFKGFAYRNVNSPIGLFGFIDDVKVDFVKQHYHPIIEEPVVEEGIRIFSIPDIIAMKINAVLKRGAKKDFWDIAELLQHYSIENFISFYNKKYTSQQLLISIPQAIIYFDDAEESEAPISLKGQTWEQVKHSIREKVRDYLS
ncbi:MAG TPA: nucleotidyl transferase AbiEii/AbiGii toxin family protein [Hanamia sp.]|nr:nucleotidyl transferase AbiEii/AbiGii toxin family protein [Hanamia sp.]